VRDAHSDGTCLPTVAIDQDSPAIDGGSCTGADNLIEAGRSAQRHVV
jgi:hypothetical protein